MAPSTRGDFPIRSFSDSLLPDFGRRIVVTHTADIGSHMSQRRTNTSTHVHMNMNCDSLKPVRTVVD